MSVIRKFIEKKYINEKLSIEFRDYDGTYEIYYTFQFKTIDTKIFITTSYYNYTRIMSNNDNCYLFISPKFISLKESNELKIAEDLENKKKRIIELEKKIQGQTKKNNALEKQYTYIEKEIEELEESVKFNDLIGNYCVAPFITDNTNILKYNKINEIKDVKKKISTFYIDKLHYVEIF
jgi:hypothetical protein